MRACLGSIAIAAGVLIICTCGLCGAALSSGASVDASDALAIIGILAVPLLIGGALCFKGYRMIVASSYDSDRLG